MKVKYNGISLPQVHTQQWTQQLIYDPSGTDGVYMRHELAVATLLHVDQLADVEGDTLGKKLAFMRQQLLQPRKTLTLEIGSFQYRIGPHQDVHAGPKPQEVVVREIFGDQAVRILFRIEFALPVCDSPYSSYEGKFLFHRWSVNETIGEDHRVHRSIAGRLRLSQGWDSPHLWRHVVFPPLEYGFARRRMVFRAPEDGLSLEYEVEDEQVSDAAPWPAARLEGSFTIHMDHEALFNATLDVRLVGPPLSSQKVPAKQLLLVRALQVAENRFGGLLKKNLEKNETSFFITSAILSESLGDLAEVNLRSLPWLPARTFVKQLRNGSGNSGNRCNCETTTRCSPPFRLCTDTTLKGESGVLPC